MGQVPFARGSMDTNMGKSTRERIQVENVTVRKLDDGSWWASHDKVDAHGYGISRQEALEVLQQKLVARLRAEEILAGDPT